MGTELHVEYRVGNYTVPFGCGHRHRTLSGAVRCGRRYLAAVSSPGGYYRRPIEIVGVLAGDPIEPLNVVAYVSGWERPTPASVDG